MQQTTQTEREIAIEAIKKAMSTLYMVDAQLSNYTRTQYDPSRTWQTIGKIGKAIYTLQCSKMKGFFDE
jgi:hypothetical protein